MTTNDLLFREQPKLCYIEFPTWQYPHYSPKTPQNWEWVPAVPPYRHHEDEKPLNENLLSALDFFKPAEKQNFTQTKDGLKFRLELAGFGKEHVSASIEEGKTLKVSAKNNMLSYNNSFSIPNPEKYNLFNQPTAKMENGLLEIFFAAKKEEVRTIKIL